MRNGILKFLTLIFCVGYVENIINDGKHTLITKLVNFSQSINSQGANDFNHMGSDSPGIEYQCKYECSNESVSSYLDNGYIRTRPTQQGMRQNVDVKNQVEVPKGNSKATYNKKRKKDNSADNYDLVDYDEPDKVKGEEFDEDEDEDEEEDDEDDDNEENEDEHEKGDDDDDYDEDNEDDDGDGGFDFFNILEEEDEAKKRQKLKGVKLKYSKPELKNVFKTKFKLHKILFPLLVAYKLKFFALIPVLLGSLILLAGTTAMATFFFALFAAALGLQKKAHH